MGVETVTVTTCDRCGFQVDEPPVRIWRIVQFDGELLLCSDCADALRTFLAPRKRRQRASVDGAGPRQIVAGATMQSNTMSEGGQAVNRGPVSAVAQIARPVDAGDGQAPAPEPPRKRRGRKPKAAAAAPPTVGLEPVLEDEATYALRADSCPLCRKRVALALDGREHVMDRVARKRLPCQAPEFMLVPLRQNTTEEAR